MSRTPKGTKGRQVKSVTTALAQRARRTTTDGGFHLASTTSTAELKELLRAHAQDAAARSRFTLASADGLTNLVAGLGATSRDKRFFSAYDVPVHPTRFDLEAMYFGSWLAKRIVSTVADDMTREWVSVSWDGYDDDVNNAQTLEDAEIDVDLQGSANEALLWSRLYGGSVVLMAIRGDRDWSKPLIPENVRKGSLESLIVLDRWWCSPTGEIDRDTSSKNYGMPLFYMVGDPGGQQARAHWTRIVRFDGLRLPKMLWLQNGYWHASELVPVLDTVKNYDTATNGIASLIWEANVDIFKSAGLAEMLSSNNGTATVQARYAAMAAMKSINRSVLLDKETEEYQQKTTSFSGLNNVLVNFMVDVCGAADIPMTRLFGQSAPGLNATGDADIRNYYDHVAAKQRTHLRKPLARLYDVLVRSALGRMPKKFAFKFKPLWQVSDVDRAKIELTRAQRDQIYLQTAVLTEGGVARELKDSGTYRTMEEEDVEMAEELAQQIEPPPAGPGSPGGAPGTAAKPVATTPGTKAAPAATAKQTRGARAQDDVSASDRIIEKSDGWHVYSESGEKHLGGPYATKAQAVERLRQVEGHKEDG